MNGFQPLGELLPDPNNRRNGKRLTPDEVVLSDRDRLVLDLVEEGVGLRKARNLVDHYPEERIRKQLRWLPLRSARRPASLLIASIERDYDAPVYAEEE
jgi:hypothetical protein